MIEEIKQALDNNMPRAALALSLMLPDICGGIEEPNAKVGARYINWITNNISDEEYNDTFDWENSSVNNGVNPNFARLTPKDIYKLRCHFLHSGDADIESDANMLDVFTLKKIRSGDFTDDMGFGVKSPYSLYIEKDINGMSTRYYEIDVDYLCGLLYKAAEKYYNQHDPKSDFDKHSVKFL
ncbi:MAG: hypothetical protein J5718_01695 [Lachnospiraceae bacterium]|nr:hypothetical protein [Lachnospiraceae bacterium]